MSGVVQYVMYDALLRTQINGILKCMRIGDPQGTCSIFSYSNDGLRPSTRLYSTSEEYWPCEDLDTPFFSSTLVVHTS